MSGIENVGWTWMAKCNQLTSYTINMRTINRVTWTTL